MEDIELKTIGQLLDELMTASQRCWHSQDLLLNESLSEKDRLNAAITAQQSNAKRTRLIRAIDNRLGSEGSTNDIKTYDK